MIDQFEMFTESGEAHARKTDPSTSQVAAEETAGERASRYEKTVLETLRSHPAGLTTHEISAISGLNYSTVTPRMKPLRAKQLVQDSGIKRLSPHGKQCIVFKAL